jgi:DinB superfamily
MIQPDCEIALLLDGLAEGFDRKSWHGPNLRGAIRGLSAERAAWRPGEGRHNIWELALHAAYWKYIVRRKLTSEKRGAFVLKGSNFFPRPEDGASPSEPAWRQDISILEAEHRNLCETVAALHRTAFNTARWRETIHLIRGAAAHDLYHAGQIRLLRRLCPV